VLKLKAKVACYGARGARSQLGFGTQLADGERGCIADWKADLRVEGKEDFDVFAWEAEEG
jgi:hypothetical protein